MFGNFLGSSRSNKHFYQKELQLKEEVIRNNPEKAMAAKNYIAKSLSGSVQMALCSLRPDHMLAGRFYVSDANSEGSIAKAGITVNDVLMKIDDEDVLGKSLDDVVDILKVSNLYYSKLPWQPDLKRKSGFPP